MKAISAMQDYLNHFLGSLDIVNTREVKVMCLLLVDGDSSPGPTHHVSQSKYHEPKGFT
jgi:hypothetical protein